jgi:hypothetical protein
MIVWTWLLKQWRIVAFAVVAALATWAWVVVGHWHEDSLALPKVKAQAKLDAAQAAAVLVSFKAAYASAQTASESYQHELEDLRNTPRPADPVVRVCRTAKPALPGSSPAKPGPDGAAPETGSVPASDLLDTGSLLGVGDRADEVSARLRALQDWVRSTR